MRISYLITVKNETDTLFRLLDRLISIRYNDSDTIVILDDFSDNEKTKHILKVTHSPGQGIVVYQHHLNNDYGSHKNFGVEKCAGDFVFQIDADELPSETLIFNIREIIETNKTMELIYVPRINDFRGVTQDHAKQWGWKLTDMEFFRPCENKRITAPIVNFPDYQSRIFKRDMNRIKWDRKLHEKIVGHSQYAFLPANEDLALYHDKTIETQIKTNQRYNQQFSVEDNLGHKVT
jgi:glycosyltransferase involved in cell wall biosynthesis